MLAGTTLTLISPKQNYILFPTVISNFSYSYEDVFTTTQQPNPSCSKIIFYLLLWEKNKERDSTRLLIAGYTICQIANILSVYLSWFQLQKSQRFDFEQYTSDNIKKWPSRHLPVQSQQWKHQNNVWNRFKVNNNNNRTTSLTSF